MIDGGELRDGVTGKLDVGSEVREGNVAGAWRIPDAN